MIIGTFCTTYSAAVSTIVLVDAKFQKLQNSSLEGKKIYKGKNQSSHLDLSRVNASVRVSSILFNVRFKKQVYIAS